MRPRALAMALKSYGRTTAAAFLRRRAPFLRRAPFFRAAFLRPPFLRPPFLRPPLRRAPLRAPFLRDAFLRDAFLRAAIFNTPLRCDDRARAHRARYRLATPDFARSNLPLTLFRYRQPD